MLGLGLSLTSAALLGGSAEWSPASLSPLFWAGSFDPATGRLWQSSTGTTPVTEAGQPVGLVFDTSKGAGTDLLPMGFSDPGWSLTGGAAITDGVYVSPVDTPSTGQCAISGPSSGWYHARVNRIVGHAGQPDIQLHIDGAGVSANVGGGNAPSFRAAVGRAVGEATGIRISHNGSGGTYRLDQLSVWHRPGIPASQPTTLSCPTLARWPKGGRRNLISLSEDIAAGSWVKQGIATVAAAAPPPNVFSAFALAESTSNRTPSIRISQDFVAGTTYTMSAIAKSAGRCLQLVPPSAVLENAYANFDLEAGTTGDKGGSGLSSGIEALGGGWYRCHITFTSGATTTGTPTVVIVLSTTSARLDGREGDGESGIVLAGVQIEVGSLTPYQHVINSNNITEYGVSSVWHLYNDGGDSLPAIFPAGSLHLAYVNELGAVSYSTATSNGTTGVDLLLAEQMADVIVLDRAFTPDEKAKIESYWARYAA